MNNRQTPRLDVFSKLNFLRIGVFIAFAALVIVPSLTVSSASLPLASTPNNSSGKSVNGYPEPLGIVHAAISTNANFSPWFGRRKARGRTLAVN